MQAVYIATILFGVLLWGAYCQYRNTNRIGRNLVVIAAVDAHGYYDDWTTVLNFQIDMAKRVINAGRDNVLLLGSASALDYILRQPNPLPEDVLLTAGLPDIWIRDFGPVDGVLFKYRPNYWWPAEAAWHQNSFVNYITSPRKCSLNFQITSDLVVDGGNVVYQADTAILTKRIYKSNRANTRQKKQKLKTDLSNVLGRKIVLIPDFGDTTGHSDGTVSFIDHDVIAYHSFESAADNRWFENLLRRNGINSGTTLVTLDSHYDTNTPQHEQFDSACGFHVNLLATDTTLYVPTFGQDPTNQAHGQSVSRDNRVLQQIRDNTSKLVVEVPVPGNVCKLGGNVRCLTWQVRGKMADDLVVIAQNYPSC